MKKINSVRKTVFNAFGITKRRNKAESEIVQAIIECNTMSENTKDLVTGIVKDALDSQFN